MKGVRVDKRRASGAGGSPPADTATRKESASSSCGDLSATSEAAVAQLPFVKMQALGNDFVVVSEEDLQSLAADSCLFGEWQSQVSKLAQVLCDRHFGVGADGLIVARRSDRPDCQIGWRYVNGDGSPADMCGNGLRCLALWAVESQRVAPGRELKKSQPDHDVAASSGSAVILPASSASSTTDAGETPALPGVFQNPAREFAIATAVGPVAVKFRSQDEITIDLGEPVLDSSKIPVSGPSRRPVLRESLKLADVTLTATCVSMGNPHCVIFVSEVSQHDFARLAGVIQSSSAFPQGVNVEFALVENRRHVRVFVWERGCGATLACASGAAATLVAGVLEGKLERSATIELPGGPLAVDWSETDNHVRLTGPARQSFAGTVDLKRLLEESPRP